MNTLNLLNCDRSCEALAQYIAQFQLPWIQASQGADNATIWAYEQSAYQVADFFFPPDYTEFLKVMGLQTPLSFTNDAAMTLFPVWQRYEYLQADGARLPPNVLLLTADGYNFEGAVLEYFGVDECDNSRSGRVFYAVEGSTEPAYLLAESLSHFLWQYTFEHCDCLSCPQQRARFVYPHESSLGKISGLLEQLGWQRFWFSDAATLCAIEPQGKTVLYAHESQNPRIQPNIWLRLGGHGRDIDDLIALLVGH